MTMFTDLKPDNILFRSGTDVSDLRIADFGLSRVKKDDELSFLTHCGTLGVRMDLAKYKRFSDNIFGSIWPPKYSRKVGRPELWASNRHN